MITGLMMFGCTDQPTTRELSGKVKFRGKPVEMGTIVLVPIEGTKGPPTGGDISQGEYQVAAEKGPVIGGTYRVEIESMVEKGRTVPNPIDPKGPRGKLYDNDIPPEYNVDSKLRVTISANEAENKVDFNLPIKPNGG